MSLEFNYVATPGIVDLSSPPTSRDRIRSRSLIDREEDISAPPRAIRRADLSMDKERMHQPLRDGHVGRLATVGVDGWPCVVPLL